MKILITGIAGFVGSNLVERLIQEGHEVIGIDNLSSGFAENIPNKCSFFNIDITDYEDLLRWIPYYKDVDCVFHLAAQSRIQPTIENPELAHYNNVNGTFNILKLIRICKIPKIVFASSSSIYGLKNECPQKEDMLPDCLSPYAVSKYIGEQYIKTWCKLYGIEGASCRFFNVWGKNEVIHLGDVAPVIGLFFRKILQDKKPITIIGDGQQMRDHTHVSDIIDGLIKAMECKKHMEGEVFNLGTGKNYSILELADMVLKSLNLDRSHIEFLPARPAEARATRADNLKAKEWFDWEPKIKLEEELLNHRNYYLNKWSLK